MSRRYVASRASCCSGLSTPAVSRALIGSLRAIVAFGHPGPVPDFADHLGERLEEVEGETQEVVEAIPLVVGGPGAIAIVADEAADHGPDALLGVSLIVLAPGSATSELDPMAPAPREQAPVDELTAVVGVEGLEREGQMRSNMVNRSSDAALTGAPDCPADGPAGGGVDHEQRR